MNKEAICNYIRTERIRGCTDDAIHTALVRSGWKEEDVVASFEVISASTSFLGLGKKLLLARNLIAMGAIFLVAGLAIFFIDNSFDSAFPPFAALSFFIASAALTPAVGILILAFWGVSKNFVYRLWVGVLALCMLAFVPATIYYFGVSMFGIIDSSLPNKFPEPPDGAIVVNFLILLPLQVVVYILASITAFLYKRRMMRNGVLGVTSFVWQGFAYMVILSILGVVGLLFALEAISW